MIFLAGKGEGGNRVQQWSTRINQTEHEKEVVGITPSTACESVHGYCVG